MVLGIPSGVLSAVVTLTTGLLGIKFRNITGLLSLICQVIVLIGAILLWTLPHDSEGGLFTGIYLMVRLRKTGLHALSSSMDQNPGIADELLRGD